ncbi:MAG: ATP-binding cassette domain-containing protein [Xanthobacteraceae bacterium]|nr:ATP-binding cassette domain-containing protein [Xanthobacteraceae bacterium]MBV9628008.1 ATP-binding cassette domain-containing protein [Xanthobacteraceae bacterium]
MNEILLDARQVEKQFGGIRALASVDVQQAVGETLGMIGPNGSGKTTFVNVVSGHLSIDAGSISFAGAPISGRRPHAITRAGLTRTYQAVRVFSKLTVADNLRTTALAAGREEGVKDSHVRELIHWLELDRRLDAIAGMLTLFEQRRLELAMRLALRPKLVMLDEPVGGLSAVEITHMMKLLGELKTRYSLFVIEHTMRVIRELADRVVVLVSGQKIADGRPEEILRDERVVRNYLGSQGA